MTEQTVRTRIAPSPTGPCHLGTARTALFNYLFAKGQGRQGRGSGTFIFRLEDTDRERSTPEFEQELYDSLHWLGLHWDEGPNVGGDYGPYRQSERGDKYRAAVAKLLESGHAYRCFCAPDELEAERKAQQAQKLPQLYSGKCRNLTLNEIRANLDAGKPFAVRFKMPDETFTFNDLVRGEVTVEGREIADFVIARRAWPERGRGHGSPIFHLSNVVDDAEMRITHVMRGEDHLPNMPKHIALFRALGYEAPLYAHLPLIMNPDGSKMSKRKTIEGLEPYVRVFREKGYLPEAMVNYLAFLGWSPDTDEKFFSLKELVGRFSIEAINKSGARFDLKKLDNINGHYIRALRPEEFTDELCRWLPKRKPEHVRRIAPLVQERLVRFSDAPEYTRFFFEDPEYDVSLLKVKGHSLGGSAIMVNRVLKWLEPLPDTELSAEVLDVRTRATAEEQPYNWKARRLFDLLRAAVTGRRASPPLFETMTAIEQVSGRGTCGRRLRVALDKLAAAGHVPPDTE